MTEALDREASVLDMFQCPERRSAASFERELAEHRLMESQLREALAHDEALLCEKREIISQNDILNAESDHRLSNNLQMIASLLSMQGRASADAGISEQLAVAAKRVSTVARLHQHLHCCDGAETLAFKPYVEALCGDFSAMLSSAEQPKSIAVEGLEIELPTKIGAPLGFIVSELITNAAKHGDGAILVRFERIPGLRYAVTVSNDGPALPESFDPDARKGLGMKIIKALVGQIGGELRFGRGDANQGARFTVLFSAPSAGAGEQSMVGAENS